LGGTLNDLTITGNRTIDGDVVHVGIVNMGLGVDTLTTSGSITLTETGVLNLSTPLDEELLGQSVLVFQDGDGFVNEGATINFLDNDLLLQYTPVVGSLRVLVGSVDPLVNNPDPNLVIAGNAVNQALNAGTLGGATFDALNTLPDASAYADAIGDALPSLSDGVGREIFETGSLAGQALDRHLAGTKSGLWGQIAVRGAEQDARSQTIEGYQSDQLVFTLGGDFALGDNLRIGLMGSYADIEVDDVTDTGALTGTQEVDSIRVGAYAAAKVLGRGFFNAEVAYLTGEVDAVRDGFFGMISSDYDFDGYAARATLGYDLLADENVSFTPTVGINAARIKFDDTVEIGGFGFGIERDDAEFLEGRLGALLGAQMSEKVSGFIQGIVIHDFADDVESVALTSSQLPGIRIAPLAREQDRFELSAGLSVDVSENFAIEVGYLGDFNDGYDAHSGRASLRIAF
ncbi:MAG: autotransporter outer membrane beta-barrel domain-containing protein, partial [Erythrobacter sp.]|nr:autotransporter outer membrane beta-barrel domain-containing protein [Erythrobacter sp.]